MEPSKLCLSHSTEAKVSSFPSFPPPFSAVSLTVGRGREQM